MEKKYYSWENFEIDVKRIVELIKQQDWSVSAIYSIPKGGLILGVTLVNILGVPLYTNIKAVQDSILDSKDVLITDDISDSGKTLIKIKDVTEYKIVTLFIKEGTMVMPDIYLRKCSKDEWLVFPWEENKYIKNDTQMKKGYDK